MLKKARCFEFGCKVTIFFQSMQIFLYFFVAVFQIIQNKDHYEQVVGVGGQGYDYPRYDTILSIYVIAERQQKTMGKKSQLSIINYQLFTLGFALLRDRA